MCRLKTNIDKIASKIPDNEIRLKLDGKLIKLVTHLFIYLENSWCDQLIIKSTSELYEIIEKIPLNELELNFKRERHVV